MAITIKRGKVAAPWRWALCGTEGIGKTTFGATCPAPVFMPLEEGTNELDVARISGLSTYAAVRESIEDLAKDRQGFDTLVIDTADTLEAMMIDHVVTAHKWEDIESPGFGKGYVVLETELRSFLAALERMQRANGMNILLVAHVHVKKYSPPDSEPFDRFDMKMREKSAALIREWCHAVFFAQHEILVSQVKGESKKRGFSTGERVIRTEEQAGYRAKNRYGLPATMKLDAGTYAEIDRYRLRDHRAELVATMTERKIDGEKVEKMLAWFDKQTNKALALEKAIERINGKAA